MPQRLADSEHEFCKQLSPEALATRCHAKLNELLASLEYNKSRARRDDEIELIELEQAWLITTINLLPILATEQFRQREANKLFLHGKLSREELRNISETWNAR